MTKDPVHVGTGGYRLGRVDNSIAREPGTNVPKIPGTSLHGAARSYAARLYETPEAAGQSQEDVADVNTNPVCYTFGYLKGKQAFSGVVNVFDAQLLFFPVASLLGPVWVTTLPRLREAGFQGGKEPSSGKLLTTFPRQGNLNLGWLMLPVEDNTVTIQPPPSRQALPEWLAIKDRLVIAPLNVFSQVVNSNLEVRTSVSINPETGAAEEHFLFTYEALPRATFLTMDVVVDDFHADDRRNAVFGEGITTTAKENGEGQRNPLPGRPWRGPADVFEAGFCLMEMLGVGGMGTRGFGRVAVLEAKGVTP